MIYTKIGLAITFSPNGLALLKTTLRYQKLFNAGLCLIHVGKKNDISVSKMNELLKEAGIKEDSYELIWKEGDPAKTIISAAEERKVDLLIAGALEKESLVQYYIGSVARKLVREAHCSVLILTHPTSDTKPFEKICVSVDYSESGEKTIKKAYQLALLEKAKELTLIRELKIPALAITVSDSGSSKETEKKREQWLDEEEKKLDSYVEELNLKEIKVNTVSLYGKQGYEANNYVSEHKGDLLVLPSPKRKMKFFDRIFQHDIEFILEEIPCALLINREYPKE